MTDTLIEAVNCETSVAMTQGQARDLLVAFATMLAYMSDEDALQVIRDLGAAREIIKAELQVPRGMPLN